MAVFFEGQVEVDEEGTRKYEKSLSYMQQVKFMLKFAMNNNSGFS